MIRKLFATALLTLTVQNSNAASPRYIFPDDDQVIHELVPGPDKTTIPSIFSILVWNVHKGEDGIPWAQDLFDLSVGHDLVALQEGMIDDFMPGIFRKMESDYNWNLGISFQWSDKEYKTGPATGATARPTEVSYRRSPGREPFIKTPKITLLTKHALDNGKTLLAANIHAINFVHNDTFREQIEDIIPTLQKHEGPAIFVGDFNTWNEPRMTWLTARLKKIGFEIGKMDIDNRKFKLDHIYARGCRIQNQTLLPHIRTSDHLPIRAMLNCK